MLTQQEGEGTLEGQTSSFPINFSISIFGKMMSAFWLETMTITFVFGRIFALRLVLLANFPHISVENNSNDPRKMIAKTECIKIQDCKAATRVSAHQEIFNCKQKRPSAVTEEALKEEK